MKLMSSTPSAGAALNAMNGWSVNGGGPTGSVARFKSWIEIVVPPKAANEPVGPGPMVAVSAGKGESLDTQVIVVSVTLMVPAMLNVPNNGDAGRLVAHNAASIAPVPKLLILIPNIP